MSITAASLVAQVSVSGADKAKADLDSVGNTVNEAGSKAKDFLGGFALAAGAAIIGIGVKSVQMAADYQQSMTMIKSLTGSTSDQMASFDSGIKQLAMDSGKSTGELSKGLYQVISAGFKGGDAMKIMTDSAHDSTIGMTDMETTTKALVVALGAYGLGAKDADNVSNEMLKTVSLGRMSMSDYAGALSTGAAAAHANKVSLEDMNATIATLTSGGVKTAGVAMTDFTQLLNSMDVKTDTMAQRIHSLGLKFDESKFKTMDYTHQVAYLEQVMKGHEGQDAFITGSKNAGQALQVLGTHASMLKDDISQLSNKQQLAKDSTKAWADTQAGFNVSMQRLQQVVNVLMINLGTQLLPIVTKGADFFIKLATSISKNVDPINVLIPVLAGLGAIVAATVVPPFLAWAAATLAATWPILLIGVAVAGLVAIFMHFYNTNAGFRDFINEMGKALQQFAGVIMNDVGAAIKFLTPYFQQAGQAIGQFGNEVGQRIAPILKQFFSEAKTDVSIFAAVWNFFWPGLALSLKGVWDEIVGIVKIAWAILTGVIKIGLDLLSGNWKQAWQDFKTMLSGVWDGIKQVVKGGIEQLVGEFRPLLVAMANIPGPIGDMAKKVLSSFDSMNDGVKKSTADMQAQSALNVARMHEQIVSKLEETRREVIKKIQDTSDPAVKKFLEMKEKSIEQMEQMHEQAASKALAMKNDVVRHTQDMQDQVVGHSIIPDMVNSIISWLGQLPGRALGAVSSMASSLGGFFTNLASQATTWGSDMISNFSSGIANAAGGLIAQAQSIASNIASILHFSKPDTGPLADSDKWMPDMMELLAHGINSNIGKIKSASLNVATTLSGPQSSFASPSIRGGLQGLSVVPSSMSQNTGPTQIVVQPAPVYLDGRLVASGILPHLTNQIRMATGTRNF